MHLMHVAAATGNLAFPPSSDSMSRKNGGEKPPWPNDNSARLLLPALFFLLDQKPQQHPNFSPPPQASIRHLSSATLLLGERGLLGFSPGTYLEMPGRQKWGHGKKKEGEENQGEKGGSSGICPPASMGFSPFRRGKREGGQLSPPLLLPLAQLLLPA